MTCVSRHLLWVCVMLIALGSSERRGESVRSIGSVGGVVLRPRRKDTRRGTIASFRRGRMRATEFDRLIAVRDATDRSDFVEDTIHRSGVSFVSSTAFGNGTFRRLASSSRCGRVRIVEPDRAKALRDSVDKSRLPYASLPGSDGRPNLVRGGVVATTGVRMP